MHGPISHEHPPEAMISPSIEIMKRLKRNSRLLLKKTVTKKEFHNEWTTPAPDFTAFLPEVADWSEGMQVPSVPIQQFSSEEWSIQLTNEDWAAAPTARATEWVGTTTD